jgi:hypothetical protein
VVADDSFSGYCYYWDQDGSPMASELSLDDGLGNMSYRDAIYG